MPIQTTSIFGKKSLIVEQFHIRSAVDHAGHGVGVIEPILIGAPEEIMNLIPIEKRRNYAKRQFRKSLDILNEIM
jgi:hypothetical protein